LESLSSMRTKIGRSCVPLPTRTSIMGPICAAMRAYFSEYSFGDRVASRRAKSLGSQPTSPASNLNELIPEI